MRISDWSSDVCSFDLFDATSSGRWVGVRSFFADALRTPVDEKIERRQHQQRKDRGGQHSSNNYSGERALHLGACSDVERSEEHTSELQSLMRISYAVFCSNKKKQDHTTQHRLYTQPN